MSQINSEAVAAAAEEEDKRQQQQQQQILWNKEEDNEAPETLEDDRDEVIHVNDNEHDGDGTDDDEYFEDPVEVIKDFGEHFLMERAHRALLKELTDINVRLKDETALYEEELKRLTAERENLGVQLYGLQQQLAKLQLTLESEHNDFNSIIDTKLQDEEIIKSITSNNREQKTLLDEHKKQEKKYASELEAINETLRQIQEYNEEVKSEIAMTRRATHKAEQSMQSLEKHKDFQDVYVDKLTNQILLLQEQISLHAGQIEAQRKETTDANAVLQDTARELELIAHEKKQLVTQWKAALAGLSRRDEALSQATQTLNAAERAVHDYDVEIIGIKRKIQKEQTRNEDLCLFRDRIESELQWVEDNLTKIRAEREQLQERFGLLTKSLTQTDGEAKKLEAISKALGVDSESLLQSLQIVTRERQKLEEEINLTLSTHSNVNKAVQNLLKQKAKIIKMIHEKEIEAIDIENETARTKVDSLNAKVLNDQLKEQLLQVTREFTEKEALIEKYQVEIRQRNDEIEKKMYRVDRLNKKYDKMVESAGGEENLGPLENTIKNLEKEIELLSNECKELEREWLKKQTEMVGISLESDRISEQNNELQARVTILTQQQIRMFKDLRTLKADISAAAHSNGDLQKDIAKLNNLINQNQELESALQNQNFVLEMECIEELKRLERESVALQASINEMKEEKAKILDEIVDSERQALLWEKKIQLDKETKAALDPSVGQQESQAMEREIHRMKLRLDALKREQERLSVEMENAVTKRTTIANRFKKTDDFFDALNSKGAKAGNKKLAKSIGKTTNEEELTQAGLKKRMVTLKKESKALGNEVSQYTGAIEEKKAFLSEMTSELERLSSDFAVQENANRELQSTINDCLYRKQLNQERISYRQKYIKRLRDLINEGIDSSQTLQVERRLLVATQALDNVKEVVAELSALNPHLQEVLDRVRVMCDPMIV